MRIARRFLLLALLLVFSGCQGDLPNEETTTPATAPRSYELPFRGSITLEVPADWQDEIRRAPGGLSTTIEFRPGSADDSFKVALNIRWSLAGDAAFNSSERVERFVRENLEALAGSYLEDAVLPEPLSGPQANGGLFRLTHTDEQSVEGRYPRRVQAVLAVDDLLVGAILVSESVQPDVERHFAEMLQGIARLRSSGLAAEATAPTLIDGLLSNPAGGYHLDVPAGWTLRSVSNSQLMMLDRSAGPATLSILLKPAGGGVADEFAVLEQGLRRRPGVEILDQRGDTVGGLEAIRMESRATVQGASFSTLNYVTVFAGAAYFMGVETADAVRDEVYDEVETMLASMSFGMESPAP